MPHPVPANRLSLLPLVILAVFLMGTKECQEDYDLGSQSTGASTATPSPTPTEDGDSTATPTPTPTATTTVTPTPAPAVNAAIGIGAARVSANPNVQGAGVLEGLSELSQKPTAIASRAANERDTEDGLGEGSNPTDSQTASSGNPYAGMASSGNWLGNAFSRDVKDADGDGFTDWLERAFDADLRDPSSIPPAPVSKLDLNALRDLDNDGRIDAVQNAAVGAGDNAGADSDGDDLPDSVERRFGTDTTLVDSDRDGASDAVEFALGSDPLSRDTDGDGILDGREVASGSDPVTAEWGVTPTTR